MRREISFGHFMLVSGIAVLSARAVFKHFNHQHEESKLAAQIDQKTTVQQQWRAMQRFIHKPGQIERAISTWPPPPELGTIVSRSRKTLVIQAPNPEAEVAIIDAYLQKESRSPDCKTEYQDGATIEIARSPKGIREVIGVLEFSKGKFCIEDIVREN